MNTHQSYFCWAESVHTIRFPLFCVSLQHIIGTLSDWSAPMTSLTVHRWTQTEDYFSVPSVAAVELSTPYIVTWLYAGKKVGGNWVCDSRASKTFGRIVHWNARLAPVFIFLPNLFPLSLTDQIASSWEEEGGVPFGTKRAAVPMHKSIQWVGPPIENCAAYN